MRMGATAIAALLLVLATPAIALACLTYVVGGHGREWVPQAVVEVEVTRVDAAGPGSLTPDPLGYEMTVLRVLRGGDVPATFEVRRADGCDTMNLVPGDRLVAALGSTGLSNPSPPADWQSVGADNYNSGWYRVLPDGGLRLVPGSSWLEGLAEDTSIEALLRAVDGLPATDAVDPAPATGDDHLILVLAALAGLLAGFRRLSRSMNRPVS